MEKFCPSCKQNKPVINFRTNVSRKDGYQAYCIPCDKAKQRKYYENNKKYVIAKSNISNKKRKQKLIFYIFEYLLQHPCVDCGETNPIVLEFDHINPHKKEYNISQMVTMIMSLDKIKKEISKCEVRCANCHRKKTAIQRNWYLLKLYQQSINLYGKE